MDYTGLLPYELGFGVDADNPLEPDLEEPLRLIGRLKELQVAAVNISAGSPYYNPHMQRPAIFPPSDGYQHLKIHWSAWPARFTSRASASKPGPACRWWAAPIRICRITCRTSHRRSFGRVGSTWSDWGGWCCRIPNSRATR